MSASAPAGNAKRKAGAALAVCNSATSAADVVSDVISQAAATTCIHEPMLDASDATHSARKTRLRSGSHGDARCPRTGSPLDTAPCLLFGVATAATFRSVWVVPGLRFEGWCVPSAPMWDGRVLDHLGVNLAVGNGESGAPFEIGYQRGAKVGVGGDSDFVGGCAHSGDPALSLLLGDREAAVLGKHVLIAAVLERVRLRSPERLREPRRDVLGVVGIHPAEDRLEQWIRFRENGFVEPRRESFEGLESAERLVERLRPLDQFGWQWIPKARIPVRAIAERLVPR